MSCCAQRGDLASGEGLEAAGSASRIHSRRGTNESKEGSSQSDGPRFFDDADVLLEELRTEGERTAHMDSAGGCQ